MILLVMLRYNSIVNSIIVMPLHNSVMYQGSMASHLKTNKAAADGAGAATVSYDRQMADPSKLCGSNSGRLQPRNLLVSIGSRRPLASAGNANGLPSN